MNISLMKRRSKLKKKINLHLLFLIIGLIVFFLSMLGFVINACTIQNIPLAWILFSFIILGSGLVLVGLIMYLIKNKEKIQNYLDELLK